MATSPYLIREAQRLKIGTFAGRPQRDAEHAGAPREKRPRSRRIAVAAASAWTFFTLAAVWGAIYMATGLG